MVILKKLTPEQRRGRAKNAVAQYLDNHLIVPKIFFDAKWHRRLVDVLAIDRAGTGDVHAVIIALGPSPDLLQEVFNMPAHFRYVAAANWGSYRVMPEALFAEDGVGRIGIFRLEEELSGAVSLSLDTPPERFNLAPEFYKYIDRFTASHQPSIETRY